MSDLTLDFLDNAVVGLKHLDEAAGQLRLARLHIAATNRPAAIRCMKAALAAGAEIPEDIIDGLAKC